MVSEPSKRRTAIIDADLSILLAEQPECQKQLQRFWENKDRDSMTFLIVKDCWEKACERQQKDSQQLPSKLSEFLDIEILSNDDINEDDLQQHINNIRQNINENQIEEDEDSTKELAYAIVYGCRELVTHKIDDFLVYDHSSLPVRMRIINPKTEPESTTQENSTTESESTTQENSTTESGSKTQEKPISWLVKLLRQCRQKFRQSELYRFRKYKYFVLMFLIGVGFSTLIHNILLQASSSICDSTSGCYFFSIGEKRLITRTIRENSHRLFDKKEYEEAYKKFKFDWEKTLDPETLIYLNNSFLEREREQERRDFNTIAVLVPISKKTETDVNDERDLAKEILRGVAQAQTTYHADIFNEDLFSRETDNNGNRGDFNFLATKRTAQSDKKGIRVIIVDDENDSEKVKKFTQELVKMDEIQAFVGHYASELTVKAVNIYNDNKKVLVSSGTTTEELSQNNYEYFFRTVPSAKYQAQLLFDYIDQKIKPENNNTNKVAVCYIKDSPFSGSLYKEFNRLVEGKETIEIVPDKCSGNRNQTSSFADSNFQAEKALREMDEADILVLFPDGQTTNSTENSRKLIEANKRDEYIKYILGSWNLRNNRILDTLKNSENRNTKLVLAVPWEYPSPNDENQYSHNVKKLWNGPVSSVTALSYDATQALISAMDDETQSLKKSLKNYSEKGVTGEISFDQYGNRKCNPMLLVEAVEINGVLKFEKISGYSKIFSESPEQCQD